MITLEVPGFGSSVKLERSANAASFPQFRGRLSGSSIDLIDSVADVRTAEHYALQWGASIGFQNFARDNPDAMAYTPSRQLGWSELFERIRERARTVPTRIYDAACGCGLIMDELFRDPVPEQLLYVGADIHGSLGEISVPRNAQPEQIFFLRWDISNPIPVIEPFDFVICRSSIHHTREPAHTFGSLVRAVAPTGRLAITAYAKKCRLRELNDDAIRNEFSKLSNEEALKAAGEFMVLGKALQAVSERLKVERDLEWLGIRAGEYGIQDFIYDHMIKCWFNPMFGEKLSSIVNFDWYHPTYAYRFDTVTLRNWFAAAGFAVERILSTKAQHYLEGVRI